MLENTQNSALKQAKNMAKYNNELEQKNVKLQFKYNQQLAQENRDWQEEMANTAHQREIADLKKAGLNPVLSVTGGNGATTPTGSAASVSKPNVDMSLTSKVMDMAMAQLNSATSLQTTAMQTANALTIAREQIAAAWNQHITPSGNSYFGQYNAFKDNLLGKFEGLTGIDFSDPNSLADLLNLIFTGQLPNSTKNNSNKTNKSSKTNSIKFTGSPLPGALGVISEGLYNYSQNKNKNDSNNKKNSNKTNKSSKSSSPKTSSNKNFFGQPTGYTSIDDIIGALQDPSYKKYGNSTDTIKHMYRKKFWDNVKKKSYSNSSRR